MNTCSTTLEVNMFASSVVDHVFIGGVMANMFDSSVVDHVFIGGVMVSTTLEANMLTITPPMNT
jgi:3-phosphoglycerate kinase